MNQAAREPGGANDDEKQSSDSPEVTVLQTFARGLDVIRVLSGPPPGLTLSEVARAANLNRATARRFLHTLIALDYAKTDGRLFILTPRVLELGYAYLSSLTLPAVAQSRLEDLMREVGESCSVAILDGDEVVFVARAVAPGNTRRLMRLSVEVGTRVVAYPNSLGRALLANLAPEELDAYFTRVKLEQLTSRTRANEQLLRSEFDRIREQGYALVDQEHEEDLRSIAVPIRDTNGLTIAAANVSTSASRVSEERLRDEILPTLRVTAAKIEADLVGLTAPLPFQRS